jgi:hypothetical protein
MSWLSQLSDELRARGVPSRERHRILAELHDHIASEPGCEPRLGDPDGLASQFADEIGLELQAIDFSSVLPGRWLALIGTLAGVAGAGLLTASATLRRSGTLVAGTAGSAGDVFDDIPLIRWAWLRRPPGRLGAAASLLAGLAVTLFEWRADRSVAEGLQRGGVRSIRGGCRLSPAWPRHRRRDAPPARRRRDGAPSRFRFTATGGRPRSGACGGHPARQLRPRQTEPGRAHRPGGAD